MYESDNRIVYTRDEADQRIAAAALLLRNLNRVGAECQAEAGRIDVALDEFSVMITDNTFAPGQTQTSWGATIPAAARGGSWLTASNHRELESFLRDFAALQRRSCWRNPQQAGLHELPPELEEIAAVAPTAAAEVESIADPELRADAAEATLSVIEIVRTQERFYTFAELNAMALALRAASRGAELGGIGAAGWVDPEVEAAEAVAETNLPAVLGTIQQAGGPEAIETLITEGAEALPPAVQDLAGQAIITRRLSVGNVARSAGISVAVGAGVAIGAAALVYLIMKKR